MARQTLLAVEEYLRASYDPDVDYVDGVLEERNMGEFEHGILQLKLGAWLDFICTALKLFVITEVRVQVAATRFRIPDICLTAHWPKGGIIIEPPLLCIEILSRDDRLSRVEARIQDFLRFGVPTVWMIDPAKRRAWTYTQTGTEESSDLVLKAGAITVPLAEIFAAIDRLRPS